jgi:chromosome segregation ATPase
MPAPVGHTCPDINKVIAAIKQAMKTAESARKNLNVDNEAHDYFHDIIYELDGLENVMEELRESNSQLRSWGEEMESSVDDLDRDLELKHAEILELQSELGYKNDEIRDLKNDLNWAHERLPLP